MGRNRVLLVVVIVAAVAVAAFAIASYNKAGPSGNQKQAHFLIVASIGGFNDSALTPCAVNGVPKMPCPVIHVARGALVNITVTNTDHQTHGFQIAHYYDSSIYAIAPGQTINVTFVANETGTFRIYCAIICTVHWAMQSGQLIVS